jgi:hypothetical protein
LKEIPQKLVFSFVASLTLGLAPFVPEPHLIGKLRWVLGGAKDMQVGDYFDLLMHGAPWLALIYFTTQWLFMGAENKAGRSEKSRK